MLKTLVLQNSKKTTFFYNTKKCILKRKEINVFCPLITRKINYTNVRSNTKDEFEFFWITNLIKYLSIMLMGAISANYRIMRPHKQGSGWNTFYWIPSCCYACRKLSQSLVVHGDLVLSTKHHSFDAPWYCIYRFYCFD